MGEVNFADILFILIVCVVTAAILLLVNRGKQKVSARKSEPRFRQEQENQPESTEDH